MRRIFIGDVQGCRSELDALLRELALQDDDRVCCVGDLVNRGPDSLGVLRRLREIEARTVLGNHDLALLRAAATPGAAARRDFEQVLEAPDAPALLKWLAVQPLIEVEEDLVVVHAGLHPQWTEISAIADELLLALPEHLDGAADERIVFATEARYCRADGSRPPRDDPPPGPPFEPWDHWYRGRRKVVVGHWSRRGLVVSDRIRGLDTGCVYGGSLTAWIAEEDRFVQVPGRRAAPPA